MQAPNIEELPPPPGVIGSIKAGFDTISLHLAAVLLPLGLDLLLWLGPRLSIKDYYQKELVPDMNQLLQKLGYQGVQSAIDSSQAQASTLDSFNLLVVLRTVPIGVTSLLSQPLQPVAPLTPYGEPLVYQIGTLGEFFGLFLLFTLLGWLGGAIYFRSVAALVLSPGSSTHLGAIGHSLVLSFLAAITMLFVGMPVLLILLRVLSINSALAQFVLLALGFMSMWVIVPLFFVFHGIFMRSQTAIDSIVSGIRMARFSLPNSSLFVLSVLFISVGLNYLWIIPKPDSWMLLIGIVGHAFITTALLAASFIYYRDTTAWLQTIFERLQADATSTKA